MKKTLLLFLAFSLLGVGVYFLMQKEKGAISTLKTNDRNFVVKDLDEIGKIFIADRTGFKTLLEKKGDDWIVNGKYKARENAIDNVLTTINTVEIKFIPPNSAIPNIVKGLSTHGIKVEIYNKAGDNIRTYYVGGVTNDERATYFLMEGAEQPYAMHMPMMEGALRTRYRLAEIDWRDRAVFGYDADEIEYVSVEYPKQKNKSFVLEKKEKSFEVKPFYGSSPSTNQPYKKGSAESYLMNFMRTDVEAFDNTNPSRDSISALVPFAIVTVKSNEGETKAASFYPIKPKDADGNPITSESVTIRSSIERFHINHSSGDFLKGQQILFGKIFWSYESFFTE